MKKGPENGPKGTQRENSQTLPGVHGVTVIVATGVFFVNSVYAVSSRKALSRANFSGFNYFRAHPQQRLKGWCSTD